MADSTLGGPPRGAERESRAGGLPNPVSGASPVGSQCLLKDSARNADYTV
jgi:hypothetical protein